MKKKGADRRGGRISPGRRAHNYRVHETIGRERGVGLVAIREGERRGGRGQINQEEEEEEERWGARLQWRWRFSA